MSLATMYHDGGAAFAVVAGCSWEAAAIRRHVGKTPAHVVRMAAWLLVGVALFMGYSDLAKGAQYEPQPSRLAFEVALLLTGIVVLVITFRAAGYSRREQDKLAAQGRHAGSADQPRPRFWR